LPNFHKKSHLERIKLLKQLCNLTSQESNIINNNISSQNKNIIENMIGTIQVPLGIATNFRINGKDYLIPMATEEQTVIAAASKGALLARKSGGFQASANKPIMIGQILLKTNALKDKINKIIKKNKDKFLQSINNRHSQTVNNGGGAQDFFVRKKINIKNKPFYIIHLIINVGNAMGANIVNDMTEALANLLEKKFHCRAVIKIVSNLSIYRTAHAQAIWKKEIIGTKTIENIIKAYEWAQVDHFRSTTHNKGIMNGIDAVAIATGNDFRALEAGAHAYACYQHPYQPLTRYYKNSNNDLVGEITIPLAVGIVGGSTQTNKTSQICLKIINAKTANELSQVMASVGLAQNFAALKALTQEGIHTSFQKFKKRSKNSN